MTRHHCVGDIPWRAVLLMCLGCIMSPAAQSPGAPPFQTSLRPDRHETAARLAWQKPDQIVTALNIKPGQVIADIGAGSGIMTRRFAAAVAPSGMATGLDVDPAMVEFMQQDAKTRGLATYRARVVPPDDPGLMKNSVDLVENRPH